MKKETDVQAELVKATTDAGGWGLKLNNRFLKGIPDLLLKWPTRPAALIEVKICPPLGLNHGFYLDLTSHQVRSLRRFHDAGGTAGWLAIGKMKQPGMWRIACGITFLERQRIEPTHVFIRSPGKPWPVEQIIEHLEHLKMKGMRHE